MTNSLIDIEEFPKYKNNNSYKLEFHLHDDSTHLRKINYYYVH